METVATTPKKVLVVDDDAIVVNAVENVLRAFQYFPLTSTQWTDALEIIHQESPDLILLERTST